MVEVEVGAVVPKAWVGVVSTSQKSTTKIHGHQVWPQSQVQLATIRTEVGEGSMGLHSLVHSIMLATMGQQVGGTNQWLVQYHLVHLHKHLKI